MNNQKYDWKLNTDLVIDLDRDCSCDVIVDDEKVVVSHSIYKKNNYTTISFKDINDEDVFSNVENILVKEIKKYIGNTYSDKVLIIGLGNEKITPDSVGPKSIEKVLVTSHLFKEKNIKGFSNVSAFVPSVTANTGIETAQLIKSIVKLVAATKVIIIDALKTNNLERLVRTIQITDKGIIPGSGVGNQRSEISKKVIKADVIAIGIPTVVDIRSILAEYIDNFTVKDNLIVTPTNIDFVIEKVTLLIGNSINKALHKDFIRQKNN